MGRPDLGPGRGWLPAFLLGEREGGQAMNYEQRSEILTIQLRRDEIINMAIACDKAGQVGLSLDLYKMAEIKESN
jgi:hypothetical protein